MWLQGLFHKACVTFKLSTLSLTLWPLMAIAEENGALDFDRETLKALGVDPAISHYFSREPRFAPGRMPVSLTVNGVEKERVIAHFAEDGSLCFDEAFLEHAGLQIPAESRNVSCYDFRNDWPATIINQRPGLEELEIVVPTDALEKRSNVDNYQTGGYAGVMNYSIFATRNEYNNMRSDYAQSIVNGGLNLNDWLLRTQQLMSYSNGKYTSNTASTWFEHTFVRLKTTMRAGEVNINNTLLDGTSIYGLTLSPDNALSRSGNGVEVKGMAQTAQARVEVRQNSRLIYSTLVPQGPFTLTDFPVINHISDLTITVVEANGSEQQFIVPAAMYNQTISSSSGVHFALGRVDDNYSKKPWVGSLSVGKNLTNRLIVNGGLMATPEYQAAAAGVHFLLSDMTLSGVFTGSKVRNKNTPGQKANVSVNYALTDKLSASTGISHATRQFRTLPDMLDKGEMTQNKNEIFAGINWSHDIPGSLSLSYVQTESYLNDSDASYLAFSWSKTIRRSTLSAHWLHQIAGNNDKTEEDLIYLNLSIPFGRSTNTNLYSRSDRKKTRFGATLNSVASDEWSYLLGTEKSTGNDASTVSAGVNANLHYTQLNIGANADDRSGRNYSAALQGGIAAHAHGITFSPLAINDTFAVAHLDHSISGVKIETPNGPVWTDTWGRAIVPALPPYRDTLVHLSTETLPRNVDVGNGIKRLSQGRGAVGNVNFRMLIQRRVMLNVTLADGKKLPRGIAIEDDNGNYLTTVVDDGVVFINNALPEQTLIAQLDKQNCRIHLSLNENSDPNIFYETATEVCR